MKVIKLKKKREKRKVVEVAVSGRLKRRLSRQGEERTVATNFFGRKIKNRTKRE